MARLIDLPPEIHVKIAHEFTNIDPEGALCFPGQRDIYALSFISQYWAGVSQSALKRQQETASEEIRLARQRLQGVWDEKHNHCMDTIHEIWALERFVTVLNLTVDRIRRIWDVD